MPELGDIAERVLAGGEVGRDEALWLAGDAVFEGLLFHANRLREMFQGDSVHLCSIINAKSGACSENCAFCAQSAHHKTGVSVYPLVAEAQMVDESGVAAGRGADRFGIVTSGESASKDRADFERICAAAKRIRETGALAPCVSIGKLSREDCEQLRAAGLERIHHNLETSERFYPEICTSHPFSERVEKEGLE